MDFPACSLLSCWKISTQGYLKAYFKFHSHFIVVWLQIARSQRQQSIPITIIYPHTYCYHGYVRCALVALVFAFMLTIKIQLCCFGHSCYAGQVFALFTTQRVHRRSSDESLGSLETCIICWDNPLWTIWQLFIFLNLATRFFLDDLQNYWFKLTGEHQTLDVWG